MYIIFSLCLTSLLYLERLIHFTYLKERLKPTCVLMYPAKEGKHLLKEDRIIIAGAVLGRTIAFAIFLFCKQPLAINMKKYIVIILSLTNYILEVKWP